MVCTKVRKNLGNERDVKGFFGIHKILNQLD